jgi:hypothetical protein
LVSRTAPISRSAGLESGTPPGEAGEFGGTVAELAEERDDAVIRLMRALDELPQ